MSRFKQLSLACLVVASMGCYAMGAPPWTYSGSGTWSIANSYLGNQYPPEDVSFPMDAVVSESPAQITLRIFSGINATSSTQYNPNLSGTYDIFRKLANETTWSLVGTVTVGANEVKTWSDTNISVGVLYEYSAAPTGTTAKKYGFVAAGIRVDQTLPKGRMVVVVAEDILQQLPAEYAQYKADLIADGWVLHEITTPRAASYTSNNTATNAMATVVVGVGGTDYINDKIVALSKGSPGAGNPTAIGQLKVTGGGLPASSCNTLAGALPREIS